MLTEALMGVFGTAFLAVFGWALHTSIDNDNRISVIETQRDDLTLLINTRFGEVARRLERIERSMNGHLQKDED